MQKKAEIMDEGAMRRAMTRISFEILEKNHGEDLLLVGIRTRGAFLAQRLAEKLSENRGEPVEAIALDVSSLRDDIPSDRRAFPVLENAARIDGRTVILVDDVLYTGRTVRAAIEAVSHMGRAARIQLAVLIDRGHRELPIRPDYIGKNLPTAQSERVHVMVRELDGVDGVVILQE